MEERLATGVFVPETYVEDYVKLLLLSRARVDVVTIREGDASATDLDHLNEAAAEFGRAPLYLDDSHEYTTDDLCAQVQQWHERHGIRLLIVDCFDFLRSPSPGSSFQRIAAACELSDASRQLKSLALKLDIVVVVLCRLSRDPSGKSSRPQLEDLRESGGLGSDADVVLVLHRPEEKRRDGLTTWAPEAELIVVKHPGGITGSVALTFTEAFMRFEEQA